MKTMPTLIALFALMASAPVQETGLSAEDMAATKQLFERLAAAIRLGDPNALAELLSPSLPQSERKKIVSRASKEFENIAYLRFSFDLSDVPFERLGPDEIKVIVPASYEYESRSRLSARMANVGETAYEFRLSKAGGKWLFSGSDLFEQFAAPWLEQVLGRIFLAGFAGILVVAFWFWMAFDAYSRTRRLRDGLLVLVSTPAGAALYFFAVYLRRKFLQKDL